MILQENIVTDRVLNNMFVLYQIFITHIFCWLHIPCFPGLIFYCCRFIWTFFCFFMLLLLLLYIALDVFHFSPDYCYLFCYCFGCLTPFSFTVCGFIILLPHSYRGRDFFVHYLRSKTCPVRQIIHVVLGLTKLLLSNYLSSLHIFFFCYYCFDGCIMMLSSPHYYSLLGTGLFCFVVLQYHMMLRMIIVHYTCSYCLDIVLFSLYIIITIIGSIYRRRRVSTLISLIRICHCCPNLCRKFTIVVLTLLLMMVSAGYNTTTVRAYCCCLYYC